MGQSRSIQIHHHPILLLAPFFHRLVRRLPPVMLFLIVRVGNHRWQIFIAEREHAVTALPIKFAGMFQNVRHPMRARAFELADEIRNGKFLSPNDSTP